MIHSRAQVDMLVRQTCHRQPLDACRIHLRWRLFGIAIYLTVTMEPAWSCTRFDVLAMNQLNFTLRRNASGLSYFS